MHDQTTTGPSRQAYPQAPDRQPVAALSAAVLVAARAAYGEDRADLAARAGLGVHVVDGAEDGTGPAWEPAVSPSSWRSPTRWRHRTRRGASCSRPPPRATCW